MRLTRGVFVILEAEVRKEKIYILVLAFTGRYESALTWETPSIVWNGM